MEDTFSTQALLLAGLVVLALGAVLLSVWPGIWPVERWFPNPLTPVKLYLVGAWREAAGARSPAGDLCPDPALKRSERTALRCLFGQLGLPKVPALAERIAARYTSPEAFERFAQRSGCWSPLADMAYLRDAAQVHLELDALRDLAPYLAPGPVHQLLRWRRLEAARRLLAEAGAARERLGGERRRGGLIALMDLDQTRLEDCWRRRDIAGLSKLGA